MYFLSCGRYSKDDDFSSNQARRCGDPHLRRLENKARARRARCQDTPAAVVTVWAVETISSILDTAAGLERPPGRAWSGRDPRTGRPSLGQTAPAPQRMTEIYFVRCGIGLLTRQSTRGTWWDLVVVHVALNQLNATRTRRDGVSALGIGHVEIMQISGADDLACCWEGLISHAHVAACPSQTKDSLSQTQQAQQRRSCPGKAECQCPQWRCICMHITGAFASTHTSGVCSPCCAWHRDTALASLK